MEEDLVRLQVPGRDNADRWTGLLVRNLGAVRRCEGIGFNALLWTGPATPENQKLDHENRDKQQPVNGQRPGCPALVVRCVCLPHCVLVPFSDTSETLVPLSWRRHPAGVPWARPVRAANEQQVLAQEGCQCRPRLTQSAMTGKMAHYPGWDDARGVTILRRPRQIVRLSPASPLHRLVLR